MTLREVIAGALAVNPVVAAGEGSVRTAWSTQRVAYGAYLPTITATSSATRTGASAGTSSPIPGVGTSSSVARNATVGLGAAMDLYTGGRRKANDAAARAEVEAARSTLVADRYAVTLAAQRAFYEVIRAADFVRVAEAAAREAAQLLRYTTAQSRAGTATRSDLLRAQLQVTTTQQQLAAAADTLSADAYALGWLAGANGPVAALDDWTAEMTRPLALDDSAIVRLAVDASPTVAATQAVTLADEAAVRAARSLYLPTISATAGYSWAASATTSSAGTRPGWNIVLGTTYPLFDGFLREDAVTRAQVAADVARVTTVDARRSARAAAAQLLGALRTAVAEIVLGTEAIRSAREDLRVQMARYGAGISTMLDVLTSQAALVQAEQSLVLARHRYRITRASLEALLGRDL
ncbi:MAG: outer rane efflux protein [Gemmatimonadetes bacterium]|nr:outer rane efflux protein [Gemmatimonadota bacterium]